MFLHVSSLRTCSVACLVGSRDAKLARKQNSETGEGNATFYSSVRFTFSRRRISGSKDPLEIGCLIAAAIAILIRLGMSCIEPQSSTSCAANHGVCRHMQRVYAVQSTSCSVSPTQPRRRRMAGEMSERHETADLQLPTQPCARLLWVRFLA
jgi:hypothetical protein